MKKTTMKQIIFLARRSVFPRDLTPRGVPVGVVRFDTSLADVPKVLVELCSVGEALAGLLRADGDDDLDKVEAAVNAAREHTLKFNAPLRASLQRAEPRVANVRGKSELFRKLDDRLRTGDAYVNQGLSTAIAAAEKLPGVELYDVEAAKSALKLRMAILAEDASGIRKATHAIRVARGGALTEHRHGLIEAGRAMEARLAAQSAMLTAMNQRHLPRLLAAVTEGVHQEKLAKLLPFPEKQAMGSLPGVLRDARAALERLKAEVGPAALEEAEVAAGELVIAERQRKEAAEAAALQAAKAGSALPDLPPAVNVPPPPPKAAPPLPFAIPEGETRDDAVAAESAEEVRQAAGAAPAATDAAEETAAAEAEVAAAEAPEAAMPAKLAEAAAGAEIATQEAEVVAAAEAEVATAVGEEQGVAEAEAASAVVADGGEADPSTTTPEPP